MKKRLTIILTAIVFISSAIFAWRIAYAMRKSNDNLPALTIVAEMSEAEINRLLMGYRITQLREVWGKPDCSNENEDIWQIGDTSLIVNYKNNNKIAICGLKDTSSIENKDNTSTEPTADWSEIPGGKRFIVTIRDQAEEEQRICTEAEELFYEDEMTEYFFPVIKSHHIIVTYNNANSEDIVTALNAGRATIADLDLFGISYFTKPKLEIEKPYISEAEFSFAEESKMYSDISPSIKTTGFVNTSKVELSPENVEEHAKKECNIEYNSIRTYLDTAACMWKVVFYTEEAPSDSQTVYLDYDGKTILIVYGYD